MYLVLVSPHLHRSSFDPTARLPESPVDLGLYCPKGHRLRDRHPYTNSGHHCDECETPLVDGVAGKFCQVVCCATRTVFALSHSMFQLCDYDVCRECIRQMESSPLSKQSPQGNLAAVLASAVESTLSPSRHLGRPPLVSSPLLPRQSPQGNLAPVRASAIDASAPSPPIVSSPLLPRQSPQGNLAAVLASAIDASALSPSRLPCRPPLFPIFFMTAPAPQVSHEVLFNAAAASPLRPSGRRIGRLRLRVSTPPQLMAEVTSVPRLQHRRNVTLSSPSQHASHLASILAITTPPRVGFPDFVPCQLFPDSPIPSILLVHQSVGPDVGAFCDACVQTEPQTPPPSSPRLDQPATLRDVRNELRALLIGLGF